jgi:two-component system response regulator AtoC
MDGLNFLSEMEARKRSETLIMMSAYGSVDIAIRCMKLGAYDYIAKPFKPDEVVLTLRKAEERQRLRRENARLKEELLQQPPARKLVFRSAAMTALAELISRVAAVSSPVLITGETGTGKELVARALHQQSPRQHAPFIAINCSAIAASLIESELFGHTKGAYTGADREHPGLFAAADGGTLFLDEIGELPLELQPKLLRVLQEKEVRPIGDTKPIKVDVRVLAATGRDLGEEIAHGRFRNDLFYRLAVVEIHVPPLRERLEDIPLLIKFFLQRLCVREGRRVPVLTGRAVARLQTYNWPGNVRELENLMEKTLILCRGEKIDMGDLPFEMYRNERHIGESLSLKQASARLEREYIQKALAVTDGNRTQAAKLLEISLRGLLYKMKELDIGMQK